MNFKASAKPIEMNIDGLTSGITSLDGMKLSERKTSKGKARRMSETYLPRVSIAFSPELNRLSVASNFRRTSIHRQFSLRLNRNRIGFVRVCPHDLIVYFCYFQHDLVFANCFFSEAGEPW